MTLLSMVREVCDKVNLVRPSVVIASNDENIRILLALAQEEGQELLGRYPWEITQAVATHTTLAAQLQGVMTTIAPGFKYITNKTFWDRTLTKPVLGPLSPLQWQHWIARTTTGPYSKYRIRAGNLYAYPAPVAGSTWAFEYQTTYFCQSSGGTDQSAWAADDDVGALDENLMRLGIIWRFKARAGLDYAEDYRIYEQKLAQAMARDGGKESLDMTGAGPATGIYTPEGSWAL